jgi:glycosyltransferase involved in cell wall biosynthesis
MALAAEFSRRLKGHYIVVSQQLRDQIESAGVMLKGQVDVIPNWITGATPPARTPRSPGTPLRIMSAGQVSRDKGVDLLIEAVDLLKRAGHHGLSLDIYGAVDGPEFALLIHKLGLEEQIRLLGPRPHSELLQLYAHYDILAFPTRPREPFGMVPLEAAARGCVPVITRRCGISEWLVHGVHCLKAARTAEAFAQVLHSIIEGRIDLAPIARRAQATAWRDFHLDVILPRIERKLAVAAGQSRAGAGSADEAYRMARMAEHVTQSLLQEEARCA